MNNEKDGKGSARKAKVLGLAWNNNDDILKYKAYPADYARPLKMSFCILLIVSPRTGAG